MYSAISFFSVVPYLLGVSLGTPNFCPDQTPPKGCLLRTRAYDEQLWKYWSGNYCYFYTNNASLYFKYPVVKYNTMCRGHLQPIPVAQIDNTTTAFYDYTNHTSMELIKKSFKTASFFNIYRKCCVEAMDCCNNHMNNEIIKSNATHCPAVWDGWSCFPPTPVDTTATLPCSSQAYSSPELICKLYSRKQCIWNPLENLAVWVEQTDYNSCVIAPVYQRRHKYHIISLAICTVSCFPAIIIFLSFQKLRKTTRVILHRNLLIAISIRNLLTILSKHLVILDALKSTTKSNLVMEHNGVACRVLAFFENSAKNCLYGCMLLDGFYLHKVIVRTFAKEIKIEVFYIVLGVLTFLPSLIWAICLGAREAQSCWMVDIYGFQWIVDSFRIAILAINIILLLDIVRVMLLKLKRKSTTKQTMAALRATLFLFPLFGIHILVTANKVVYDDSCTAEDVYEYARYTMEALQGILVAVLFCYANTEVHEELQNGYRKLSITIEQRFGWKIGRENKNRRRTTALTYVSPEEFKTRY